MAMTPEQRDELEALTDNLAYLEERLKNPVEAKALHRIVHLLNILANDPLGALAVLSLTQNLEVIDR